MITDLMPSLRPQACRAPTSSVVVGGILLAGDESFGMEQAAVLSSLDLINDTGLKINED